MQPPNPRQYKSWLDKQVEELIGDGDVSHLPNAGRKLDWSRDDPNTPADMRMAYKIMRDHEVMPEWIALGQELDALLSKIERLAKRFEADYLERRTLAERKASALLLRDAEARWAAAQERLHGLIAEYNSKLLIYNITRPSQVNQREPLPTGRWLQR
jgi:hypothetical protein